MRMSGFLIGGLVGAAAATYFSRGNKISGMMPNVAMSGIGTSVGKAMSAMITGSNKTQNNSAQKNNQPSGNQDPRSLGLDKVSELVSKDSFVKAQVNGILSENAVTEHMVR
ncbi:MAG: hypothetical protein K6T85_18940 [Gorillibacterium sp.]|nr:hypothetical protein [Gorillibacterium sp.]